MPRGVRKAVDFGAELAIIDEKIAKQAKVMAKLKAERKAILDRKNKVDIKALQAYIDKEGKTAAEIMDIVAKAGK
ncbi:MAG: hypothetical protein FWH33_05675 [Oscillospiraceae bacterium]|nr:hypothetical protein [Oscillospiraceae bacterium]